MAEEGKRGIGATLTHKLGPLPAWTWALAGGIVGWWWWNARKKAQLSVQGTPTGATLGYGAAPGSGGILGTGLGAGGFVDQGSGTGTGTAPVIAPPVTTPVTVPTINPPPPTGLVDWWTVHYANGNTGQQGMTPDILANLLSQGFQRIGKELWQPGAPGFSAITAPTTGQRNPLDLLPGRHGGTGSQTQGSVAGNLAPSSAPLVPPRGATPTPSFHGGVVTGQYGPVYVR